MSNLSDRLKTLRTEKGIKQKDVANILGITTSAYGFYEQGKRTPTIEVLLSLSQYYKVSLDWLISGFDDFGDNLVISDDNEKYFIEKYRKLNNIDKIKIEGMVDLKLVESSENHC